MIYYVGKEFTGGSFTINFYKEKRYARDNI